jgi:Rrf2 family protein
MISVSKKVEYGVEIISYLAKNTGKIMSLSEAARDLHLPYRFLGQVAAKLGRGGIIKGREGKNGGYVLTRDWKKKNMYDLLVAFGENKGLVGCLGEGGGCTRQGGCHLRGVWRKVETGIYNELKKIKLNEIQK